MACRCSERRDRIAAAARAVRTGRIDAARREVAVAGRSLTEDAQAFARGLQARLARR